MSAPQQPWSTPTRSPEEFYRRASSTSLPAVSPADSEAPIMSAWTTNGEFPPGTTNLPKRPDTADSIEKEESIYSPQPPLPTAFTTYRSSIAVVNGEVGSVPDFTGGTPTSAQYARYPIAPLSAGLKTSGTTADEDRLAELEMKARGEDKKDLAVKLKVRLAKVVLRSINCACSLVVLALVSSTFSIFFTTRNLSPRNGFRPWSATTPQWPQVIILVIAALSLMLSLFIMYSYWKGGHNRAEKVALHATIFAGAVFIFTIAMWSIGIGIMQGSRSGNDDQDLWGWSCKDNVRRKLFEDTINYTLVCRQQDWVVVCAIIEISVEFLAICVYLFAFYRLFFTKRKLRKSMNVRDEARSSLWLAKLRDQKDLEEGVQSDPETHRNTTYNQCIDPNEGRTVPILQPAPTARRGQSAESTPKFDQSTFTPMLQSNRLPPKTITRLQLANPPPTTPRSALARLNANSEVPPTPRSVSFLPPPRTPGSRGSDKS